MDGNCNTVSSLECNVTVAAVTKTVVWFRMVAS